MLIKQIMRRSFLFWLLFSNISFAVRTHDFIIKEGEINVPGGSIWYQIVSSEKTKNNTPLLILHGGPGIPHDYLKILKKLAQDRPVIFYDQLGCGRSQSKKQDTVWNLAHFEQELEIVINTLQLKKLHLLGHSFGGALAVEYGLKHPERLQSIILSSPLLSTPRWIEDSKALIQQLPAEIQTSIETNEQQGTTDSEDYLHAIDVYYHHFVCRLPIWPNELKDSFAHFNLDIYKTMWGPSEFTMTGNLKDFDRINDLKYLTMPVLITGGQYDEARPETLKYAVKQLPQGMLIIYPNSSHLAFLEEEKKYLTDVRKFLNAPLRHYGIGHLLNQTNGQK